MIPVNEPLLGAQELENVAECVRTGWVSSAGRFIEEFESGWASYCGRQHGVAVFNGTVALQAAMVALDLQPGDEVILPTFTIISCVQAVLQAGGVPVLVDADQDTWTMDVKQVERRLTYRTRAIMPVHIYGHPVEMAPLLALAERHGLAVVEDAAEAHGAACQVAGLGGESTWRRCGSFGVASCFSFYANKLLTTGEGGMVVTDDHAFAERVRALRNLCFDPDRRFRHQALGFNFRMTNMQAALGVAQLARMDEIVARKRRMGQAYAERLAGVPGLTLPVERAWARHVYWMFGVVVDERTGRDAAWYAQRLAGLGVETRPFFVGMHEQPVLLRRGLFTDEQYPVAERLARQGFYLPSGLALTDQQLDQVVDAIREVFR